MRIVDQNIFMQPVFSVITVCLNDIKNLRLTASSVVGQAFNDYEWLVIDGGSGDGTLAHLESIDNDRLRLLTEPDNGLYDAMNKGVGLAQGQYLLFINAGDSLADEQTLAKLHRVIQENELPDFVYGDSLERTVDGRLLLKKSLGHERIWYGMFTHHQAMVYKRSLIGELRYELAYPIGADYAFTIGYLRLAKTVLRLDWPVCVFQQGGMTYQSEWQAEMDQWCIRRDKVGVSLPARLFIWLVHWASHILRSRLPFLYRALRFARR